MNRIMGVLILSLFAGSAAAQDESFHCDAAKRLLGWLEGGPDRVTEELQRDPSRFTRETIPGWVCLTTPFPPERNGHRYVENISCSLQTGSNNPSDADFATAGKSFQKNLNAYYGCFGDDILNTTPQSYTRTTRGEGMIGLLKRSVGGHPLLIEYGYFRNSSPATPIIWEITAGYSQASAPPSAADSSQVCDTVRQLVKESISEFGGIKRNVQRREGGSDWTPSISVPGALDCDGQTDRDVGSSVSCTMADYPTAAQASGVYGTLVGQMKACLDSRFVFSERQGGKASRRTTPISEATFEIKGRNDGPDGPSVRVNIQEFHRSTRSGYEVLLWVDGVEKE
jgi:hypothetical protein